MAFKRIAAILVGMLAAWTALTTSTRSLSAQGGVNVLTQRNDDFRTGANLAETALTPATVTSGDFGLLYSFPVDGQVYAQPLYVSGISIQGATRNVAFIATEHNTVYAFDADVADADPLWSVNLGPAAPQDPDSPDAAVPGCTNLTPEVGITSTPVIDLNTGTIYVVAKTRDDGGDYHQHIHALNILDGSLRRSSEIAASVSNAGRTITFDPRVQLNRPGLLLANGSVYVAFGSHCDLGSYQAWVMGYDAATLARIGTYLGTPDGNGAIWQSGVGLSADNAGIYAVTANGQFSEDGRNLSNSVVRLVGTGNTLAPVDSFTPYNTDYLTEQDADLGSSGPVLIPGTNLLLTGGKEGKLYLVDRAHLGGFDPFGNNVVQSFQATDEPFSNNIHGAPVYWNGPGGRRFFVWAENEAMKAFSFDGSYLNETPVQQSLIWAPWNAMPGGMLAVSANGSTPGTGIVWANIAQYWDATSTIVGGVLRAFDAEDLTQELWTSDYNNGDDLGMFSKFSPPTVANGKVFVPTFSGVVRVYGLHHSDPGGGGTPGGGTPSPHGGTAPSLPGIIQAEDFDDGGEAVGYHDLTPQNSGGEYRATGVDIETTSEGGYDVGWMQTGEWLGYTVAVQAAGTYQFSARVASNGGGGRFHVEVNGIDRTGPINVPDTGDWQSWVSVTKSLTLAAGQQQLRIVVDNDGANLDYFSFQMGATGGSTPFGGSAAAVPGTIMAAAFDDGGEGVAYHDTTAGNSGGEYRSTDVDIESAADTGGGYDIGWMKPGEWLIYSVNIAAAGNYTATFRVAARDSGGTFHLEVQGTDVTGPLTIPNTGDYQAWRDVAASVTLPAGPARLRFVVDAAGAVVGNLRSLTFTAASAPPSPPPSSLPPIPGVINAVDFDNGGEGVSWHDTSPANNGGVYRQTSVDIESCSEGGFDVGWIAAGEWLNYTVNVTAAGSYLVQLRVASPNGGGSMHVGFNTASNVWATVAVPATGDWQSWTTVSLPVTLGAGPQQITLLFDTGGFNIRQITVVKQ